MKLGYKRYIALYHTAVYGDGGYRQFWADTVKNKILVQDRNSNDSWFTRYVVGHSLRATSTAPILMLGFWNMPIFKQLNIYALILSPITIFIITDLIYEGEEYFDISKQPLKEFKNYEQMQVGRSELLKMITTKIHGKKVQMIFGTACLMVGLAFMILKQVSGISWFFFLLGCCLMSDGMVNRCRFLRRWFENNY